MEPATMLGMAAISGGLGLAGDLWGGGGETHYVEPHAVYLKDYPWYKPMAEAGAGYAQDTMTAARRGENAPWVDQYFPEIESGLEQQLYDQYFGASGYGPSAMDQARSAGAALGLGGASAMSPINKTQQDYQQKLYDLSKYIASKKLDINRQMLKDAQSYALSAKQGPRGIVVGGQTFETPGGPNPLSQTAAMLPYLADSFMPQSTSSVGSPGYSILSSTAWNPYSSSNPYGTMGPSQGFLPGETSNNWMMNEGATLEDQWLGFSLPKNNFSPQPMIAGDYGPSRF